MQKINYITNLKITAQRGGWDGINYRMHAELSKHAHLSLCDEISPRPDLAEKIISKIRRVLHLGGSFFFFSEKRLHEIAREVDKRTDANAVTNFYFGATPWIRHQSKIAYATYLDASFPTYLEVYSSPSQFASHDIDRIAQLEAQWLTGATRIFWGSTWALKEAALQYNFDSNSPQHVVINTGGNIPIPAGIEMPGEQEIVLLFISLNFAKKGGHECFETFKKVKGRFPQTQLRIIGQCPPESVLQHEGVEYVGLLDKTQPDQLKIFIENLKRAFFLVHPTKMDTMGAVIIEAGYYGCPSIAPRLFGVPDLIRDGKTGFLIDQINPQVIADRLITAIENRDGYKKMREDCFAFCSNNFSWEAIGMKIAEGLNSEK